ncbi:hypothetical protein ACHAWF_002434 [Thalassiosira exigua]
MCRSTIPRPWKRLGPYEPGASERAKHVRSTKPKAFCEVKDARLRSKKERDIYTAVYKVCETMFSDRTSQFLKRSLLGNRYIMVLMEIDSSRILVGPIKNRTNGELTQAYEKFMGRLKRAGVQPHKHLLEELDLRQGQDAAGAHPARLSPTKCSGSGHLQFQGPLPEYTRRCRRQFPLHLWDRILLQAEITIDLLCQSNATPTILAYAHLNEPLDYECAGAWENG